jgi:hypothetical protein
VYVGGLLCPPLCTCIVQAVRYSAVTLAIEKLEVTVPKQRISNAGYKFDWMHINEKSAKVLLIGLLLALTVSLAGCSSFDLV